jgi:striatin 1/3/4
MDSAVILSGLSSSDLPVKVRSAVALLLRQWRMVQEERVLWEYERGELQARINKLEEINRLQLLTNADLARRAQLLEYGLRQERMAHSYVGNLSLYEEIEKENVKTAVTIRVKRENGAIPLYLLENRVADKLKKNFTCPPGGKSKLRDCLNDFGFIGQDSMRQRGKSDDTKLSRPPKPTIKNLPRPIPSALQKEKLLRKEEAEEEEKQVVSQPPTPEQKGSLEPPMSEEKKAHLEAERKVLVEERTKAYDQLCASLSQLGPDDKTPKIWKPKLSLRSHLDCVRSISFIDGKGVSLLSCSDDGTIKAWDVSNEMHPKNKLKKFKPSEPVCTYLGHRGMVCKVVAADKTNNFFSGGLDGRVMMWDLPSKNQDPYEMFGKCPQHLRAVLWDFREEGSVWDLATHPSRSLLFAASANATLAALNFEFPGSQPVQLYRASDPLLVPSALALSAQETSHLLAAYTSGDLVQFDIETGQAIRTMRDKLAQDDQHVTKIVSHGKLPLICSAHVDHFVRFFDIKQGACVGALQAHNGGLSTVDVSPSGQQMVTGSEHFLRFWDLSMRKPLQDLDPHLTHRTKFDEAVLCAQYHPNPPVPLNIVASSGADGIVKLFT